MRRTPWTLYLWPGLPQLWKTGSWAALATAFAAALALNFALASSFAWSELIGSGMRSAIWVSLGIGWIAAAVYTTFEKDKDQPPDPAADAFAVALDHYLKGDWFAAERLIVGLLQSNPRDVETRLLLATLFRHTKRPREAEEQLDILDRMESAAKWELEIGRERRLLAEANNTDDEESVDEAADQMNDRREEAQEAA